MRRLLTIVALLMLVPTATSGATAVTDSLLEELDRVIAARDVYLAQKTERIAGLQRAVEEAADDRGRFEALGHLYEEYHSFNTDSAYAVSLRLEALAEHMGDRDLILNARLNKANILSSTGMYYETLDLIDSIAPAELPDYLRPYYFHTLRTVYGYLGAYSAFEPERERYAALTDAYRDSLLTIHDAGSLFHLLIRADQLNVHHRPAEAVDLLRNYLSSNDLAEHDRAICAWTLAESYQALGEVEHQKEQLLISAISDMKSAVREYISLRELAMLLYREGDLDRAYSFLTIAVDDAAKCNARQRIVELNDSYPMINGIYIDTVRSQKKSLQRTVAIITVLTLVLVVLLLLMRTQMKRLAEERRKVGLANAKLEDFNGRLSESNDRLEALNGELRRSNVQLQEANRAIAEISRLKEVYIGRYMDQSLSHIELLDGYRKSVGKLAGAGKLAELQKLTKSTAIVDDQLKAFYDEFDRTFLSLFPTFVEDLNALLRPEEAIVPKRPGALTPELRIFALIRLGIADSDRIARFLHYSLTTIYNYRTKVRNKARGDRAALEEQVLKIGQVSPGHLRPKVLNRLKNDFKTTI